MAFAGTSDHTVASRIPVPRRPAAAAIPGVYVSVTHKGLASLMNKHQALFLLDRHDKAEVRAAASS